MLRHPSDDRLDDLETQFSNGAVNLTPGERIVMTRGKKSRRPLPDLDEDERRAMLTEYWKANAKDLQREAMSTW